MSAVDVRPHPTKGRALYATRAFAAGATILPFTPLLLLPSLSHLSSVCSHCLKPGDPRACSRCQAAYYCDAACQTAGWSTVHARECKPLQRVQAQGRHGLPTPVRALMQALLKPGIAQGLGALEGHAAMWRESGRWKDMEMMAMGASAFAGKGTVEADVQRALDFLCKVRVIFTPSLTPKPWLTCKTDPDECVSQIRCRPRSSRHLPRADPRNGQPLLHA